MNFPKKIELCRHCTHATFEDIIHLTGNTKNCGMYIESITKKDGKCSIDNKKCTVVIYTKES